ncbi:MAG TPA: NADH:flavin oxidoreductase/NADH oxidase family protein [Candidatus Hydrogenedentes bacterium]|nr:NADH:flavin oxidoreductase/NADH oxidase family protein [Candidatus Hydrogenedentota bacterium]
MPCGAILPNRFAKAAMTEQMADPHTNAPNDQIIRLYERWAKSGAGMLLTGNVMIDRVCMENLRNVAVEDERDLERLKRWASVSQAHGAQLWMQISHAGRQSPKKVTKQPVAPSAVPFERSSLRSMFGDPRALTENEIHGLIAAFARTAAVAQKAGFSGVQLHGAHGYLISEFLTPKVNKRTDAWGGSIENRMRFLIETVRAVRQATGQSFPICVKLNSADFQRGGFSQEDSLAVVQALDLAGIDLLEISGGNYENPAMMGTRETTRQREAYFMEYAEKMREVTKMPLMVTGGFRTARGMVDAVSSGAVDVVGLARPLCVEPEFCAQILNGIIDHARPIDVRTGMKLFDDMLQSFWHNHQMRRMANGLDPNPESSKWLVLARGIMEQAVANPFSKGRSYETAK